MSELKNPWDAMASYFNTNVAAEDIESNAADNIYISWPVIVHAIREHTTQRPDSRALDFGCGAGLFTNKLHELGFETTGVDSSPAMIEIAADAHEATTKFKVGDDNLVPSLGKFTVVTSLMTLQFIETAPRVMRNLASALEVGGLLVFSVFNPAYAKNAYDAGLEFFDFDFSSNPAQGYMELVDDARVKTFIRNAEYYKRLGRDNGLEPVLEAYPGFTKEFLQSYPHPVPTTDPEYMILGFQLPPAV